MRQPSSVSTPVALTVAGSDSGGGAGVQADLKTFEAHGTYGTSAVTAVTAQHTRGVESTHVLPPQEVAAQVDAVREDYTVAAAKTGMLATADVVDVVNDHLDALDAPVVVDPVMVATSGDRLLDDDAERAYDDLLEIATLVTPNTDEAAVLTDRSIDTVTDARDAARALLDDGPTAALVTGGHLDDATVPEHTSTSESATAGVRIDAADTVTDVLATPAGVTTFTHERVADAATHGSGCTLSAAITAALASNDEPTADANERAIDDEPTADANERAVDGEPTAGAIERAVDDATTFVARAVRYHHDVGDGPGAVNHAVDRSTVVDRSTAARDVETIVRHLENAPEPFEALLPEVGTNVVGAPPTADAVTDTVAVDGRLTSTHAGVRATGGVHPGASSHVARFLLAAREHDPALQYAANCRYDDAVARALDALDWPTAEYDRRDEPDDAPGTMDWGADRAYADRDDRPVAVVDRGAHGKEPMTKLATETPTELLDRLRGLAREYDQ